MPSSTSRAVPACVSQAALFQDGLLEEPPVLSAPPDVRRRAAQLERAAAVLCGTCPMRASCLYDAVVRHDVVGYVAGTTARDRTVIRRRLGVTVEPEDLDALAGVAGGHRQIDHDEVIRLRQANPHESLETLARRLGCSLSTIKRHLRAERNGASRPRLRRPDPTPDAVLAAYESVTANRPVARPVAA